MLHANELIKLACMSSSTRDYDLVFIRTPISKVRKIWTKRSQLIIELILLCLSFRQTLLLSQSMYISTTSSPLPFAYIMKVSQIPRGGGG